MSSWWDTDPVSPPAAPINPSTPTPGAKGADCNPDDEYVADTPLAGLGPIGPDGRPNGYPATYRNNNPSALDYPPTLDGTTRMPGLIGQQGRFSVFKNPEYGFAAQTAWWDRVYYGRFGHCKSIRCMATRHTPPGPPDYNDTEGYIRKITPPGIDPNADIPEEMWRDPDFRFQLQRRITIEEGIPYDKMPQRWKDALPCGIAMRGITKKDVPKRVGDDVKPQYQPVRVTDAKTDPIPASGKLEPPGKKPLAPAGNKPATPPSPFKK